MMTTSWTLVLTLWIVYNHGVEACVPARICEGLDTSMWEMLKEAESM